MFIHEEHDLTYLRLEEIALSKAIRSLSAEGST